MAAWPESTWPRQLRHGQDQLADHVAGFEQAMRGGGLAQRARGSLAILASLARVIQSVYWSRLRTVFVVSSLALVPV